MIGGGDMERKAIILLQILRWMKSLMLSNVYVLQLYSMAIKNVNHFF